MSDLPRRLSDGPFVQIAETFDARSVIELPTRNPFLVAQVHLVAGAKFVRPELDLDFLKLAGELEWHLCIVIVDHWHSGVFADIKALIERARLFVRIAGGERGGPWTDPREDGLWMQSIQLGLYSFLIRCCTWVAILVDQSVRLRHRTNSRPSHVRKQRQ
jgi:hypothetical protein